MSSAAHLPQPPGPTLEIAHVLFLDVVGYSKLGMDQQQEVLVVLQGLVRETADFRRSEESHQLIRLPTGDGMALVFLADPEAPARCALDLAVALRERPHIGLRMGIHTGPVYQVADINANRNVAGGGINMAQRVMDCGDAGHILLSKAAAELISSVGDWATLLHDLGEAEVKHGVRIHLFNLYRQNAGNTALPEKMRAAAKRKTVRKSKIVAAVLGILLAAAGTLAYLHYRRAPLAERDAVVLADFANATGDPVFDGTLQQGLGAQLEQSPFLSIFSDQRVHSILRLMGQPADARLTPEVARDVCQRAEAKAVLSGKISRLGSQYVLALDAVNCSTGDVLARAQVEAASKEKVLKALDQAAATMRKKLGESLSSIQKFGTPVEQVTTPSLEALKAYSTAVKVYHEQGDAPAIPFYKRAIELDPNFAVAYVDMGVSYEALGEDRLASENIAKAFAQRERVSERERLRISAFYYSFVTGELEKASESYQMWIGNYPRDPVPLPGLALTDAVLGRYERALGEYQEALRLDPADVSIYLNLLGAYLALNRLDEARATAQQAIAQKLDSGSLRQNMYTLAFLSNDPAGMARQLEWGAGKAGDEDPLLSMQSDTEAYFGRLGKAREFSQRAVESALRNNQKETAAGSELNAALREAEIGNAAAARKGVDAALALASSKGVKLLAALTLARAGDAARAQQFADEAAKSNPTDTVLNFYVLPTINAAIDLDRSHPAPAIALLEAAAPYELGSPPLFASLYPVYVRGLACLQARSGPEAAVEFKKILDHRSIVANSVLGALAHLGVARARAMGGDSAGSRAAYQEFFALWKDAEADIPILRAARAEYAALK